jgi:hypothetical protein
MSSSVLEWHFPFVVARLAKPAEAISVGLVDCRASLAMTKKERLAATQEVIANIRNTHEPPAYLNQVKRDDRTLKAQVTKEESFGAH